jgi:HSP20 family protein
MATTLTRWDPFREMATFRNAMDRFFGDELRMPALRHSGEELDPNATLGIDVVENNDALVVKAAVPGVDPADVDINVENDVLTIKGEYRHKDEQEGEQYHRRELRFGSFHRSLRLPPTVEAEKANATFEHGVLTLTLPKKAEARAKSIKITPQGVIEQ